MTRTLRKNTVEDLDPVRAIDANERIGEEQKRQPGIGVRRSQVLSVVFALRFSSVAVGCVPLSIAKVG